ncbi:MAG: UDP-N-acetylmuramoyl-L-alanine--D-glutamate ligase [Gemmatimonadales bacterium]
MSFAVWRATGREAAVIGLARSGVAAAQLLRREQIPVYASDASPDPAAESHSAGPPPDILLRRAGAEVQLGGHDLARIARAGVCVVSPGVPPMAPPIRAALEAGVPVISELDVGFAAMPDVKYAVITGTNGKTTTTALTAHLLQVAGVRAEAAGNIGAPLAALALEGPPPEWAVVEASSFQLHDTHELVPTVGAMTNLAPDHLDRYPTLEAYYADKDLLYRNAGRDSVWVINADDAEVERRAAGRAGRWLRFSLQGRAEGWYDRAAGSLMLGETSLLPRAELALFGDHNVANALCAALIAIQAGAGPAAIAAGLRSFRALPHRMEPVGEVGGVVWINDSKATNVASTLVAVQALQQPFVLLLGGRHKGEPYTALTTAAGDRCRAVVAYGESRDQIVHDLKDLVTVVARGTDFSEVLRTARELTRPGDAVLLSPACSSYDMFQNYEDRGAQFRAAVGALKEAER